MSKPFMKKSSMNYFMPPERVIEEINRAEYVGLTKEEADNVKEIASAAIRHSIPQKPVKMFKNIHNGLLFGYCPDCMRIVMCEDDICNYCGQILDWTEPWHWDTPKDGYATSTPE